MTTVAVLPVKRLDEAKQRLGDALGAEGRRALAEAMVGDVLDALTGAAAVDAIVVVTGEPAASALAAAAGAATVADPDDAGHVRAARRGVTWALEHGAARALLVPGDCPALDPDEVDGLLTGASGLRPGAGQAAGGAPERARAGGEVIVVPDRHGTGTNALVLTPPDAIVPSFGPGSRARHEEAARVAGARVRVAEPPSLLLDVDTADDLAALRTALGRRTGGAARTRAVLAGLAP
jgi:2-phospho-L-lactate/phosphoenolpyruvate guanylyltransferase